MILLIIVAVFNIIFSGTTMKVPKPVDYLTNDDGKKFFNYLLENGTLIQAYLEPDTEISSDELLTRSDYSVTFQHYLIGQSAGRQITSNCHGCLSNFIVNVSTVFIVHGFSANGHGTFPVSLRNAFSKRNKPVNIVVVDWGSLAAAPYYNFARSSIDMVGAVVANMIDFLIDEKVSSLDKIVYIGHSLGAHIGNFVTARLSHGKKLHRVFALDPALPLFKSTSSEGRIDASDGDLVVVVHTSAGSILEGGLAFQDALGHIDFYPNSGRKQPGCPIIRDAGVCSHARSYYFLAEAIHIPSAFPACKCNSWIEYENGHCVCDLTNVLHFELEISDK